MALLCAFLPAALGRNAAPAPEALIGRAIAAENAQDAKDLKFTWRVDEEFHPVDKNGKALKTRVNTYDAIMLEGENYERLILVDGAPPDVKLQRKIDQTMEKERAARRAHPGFHGSPNLLHFPGTEALLRLFDNKVASEETVSGRRAWRVESEPKANYKPATEEETELMCWRATTWFDEEEGVVLRDRRTVVRAMHGYQPGSANEREYAKQGGAWLPARVTHPYYVKAILNSVRGETRYRYYDYKKFDAQSRVVD